MNNFPQKKKELCVLSFNLIANEQKLYTVQTLKDG